MRQPFPLEALAGYTALVNLNIVHFHEILPGECAALWALTQLETLLLPAPPPSFQIGQLSRLSRLQTLQLRKAGFEELPSALSALVALTELHLSLFTIGEGDCLRPLRRLQRLGLSRCGLQEVPRGLSDLTGLRTLHLNDDFELQTGWQHLRLLTQL